MYLPFYYRIFLYYILINFITYYVLNLSKNHIPKSVLFAYEKNMLRIYWLFELDWY